MMDFTRARSGAKRTEPVTSRRRLGLGLKSANTFECIVVETQQPDRARRRSGRHKPPARTYKPLFIYARRAGQNAFDAGDRPDLWGKKEEPSK